MQLGVKRTRKYFKVNKIARARWAAAICSLYLHKIVREIMFFHISNIPFKKHHSGSRLTEFWKLARANCNLHSCSNFALVLHEIALVFSQSINLLHLLPIKTKVKDREIYTIDIYFKNFFFLSFYKDQAAVGSDKQRLIEFLLMLTLEVELHPRLNSLPILFPWSYFLTHFVTSTCVCFFFFRTWLT